MKKLIPLLLMPFFLGCNGDNPIQAMTVGSVHTQGKYIYLGGTYRIEDDLLGDRFVLAIDADDLFVQDQPHEEGKNLSFWDLGKGGAAGFIGQYVIYVEVGSTDLHLAQLNGLNTPVQIDTWTGLSDLSDTAYIESGNTADGSFFIQISNDGDWEMIELKVVGGRITEHNRYLTDSCRGVAANADYVYCVTPEYITVYNRNDFSVSRTVDVFPQLSVPRSAIISSQNQLVVAGNSGLTAFELDASGLPTYYAEITPEFGWFNSVIEYAGRAWTSGVDRASVLDLNFGSAGSSTAIGTLEPLEWFDTSAGLAYYGDPANGDVVVSLGNNGVVLLSDEGDNLRKIGGYFRRFSGLGNAVSEGKW